MSRPKGLPKTGGRIAGTPNRNTLALIERLENLGCDPIEGLANIALDPTTKPELKVRCFAELAQYVYPKRKAIDFAADDQKMKFVVEFIGGPPEQYRDGLIETIGSTTTK